MDKYQNKFIYNEIWTLTFGAAFQRANVYVKGAKSDEKKKFKKYLQQFIETDILPVYQNNNKIDDKTHIHQIKSISDASHGYISSNILSNNHRLNFGVSQKLLNLLLKYLWCLFDYPEPPHFPLDRRIQESLFVLAKKSNILPKSIVSWTQINDSDDYMAIIEYIRVNFLYNQTLSQFELEHFERRRNQL
ncbi:MAG: hypothetical protein CMH46_16640 [Muricauda sp.]|nr:MULTISPECIES: hypothetical protein [unclassified Allomuricauda]MAU17157.1 hypothetical protein [Allomuricauda sp.]|tara:strand:- start:3793 stop:4362 length:570 start_codon:yes stop_codon:yes gene_type:complete